MLHTESAHNANEKAALTAAVEAFGVRAEGRPRTTGPVPHTQWDQLAEDHKWEDELFEYVKTFDGVYVARGHIEGSPRAFFLTQFKNLRGKLFENQFMIDNEFAHIHEHQGGARPTSGLLLKVCPSRNCLPISDRYHPRLSTRTPVICTPFCRPRSVA